MAILTWRSDTDRLMSHSAVSIQVAGAGITVGVAATGCSHGHFFLLQLSIIQSLPCIPPGQRYQMNVVCYMLYVVYLGLLVPSWGCIGRTLGPLGLTLGLSWAMSGPSWDHFGRSWEVLGHTLGFRV